MIVPVPSHATFGLYVLSVTGKHLTPRARKVNSFGCPLSLRDLIHEWTRERKDRKSPKSYRSSCWQGE